MVKCIFGLLVSSSVFLFLGCSGSRLGGAVKEDKQPYLVIDEKADVIDFSRLKNQQVPDFAARIRGSRGIVSPSPLTGNLLSMATNAVKKLIAKEKSKFTASYKCGLNNLYFYDQLTETGAIDPVGMQFNGFRLMRTIRNRNLTVDTAFAASFVLDTMNAHEIVNNSLFRLRLADLTLNFAKAKVPERKYPKINMDIEISFNASYFNANGTFFENVSLGKFYLLLRDAPLDKSDPAYAGYYRNLKGRVLEGRSFIVPRSFGYRLENGQPVSSYSRGLYTINAKVVESSKNSFINTFLMDNTELLIEDTRKNLEKKVNKMLSPSIKN